jgi:renal tumor antigen
MDVPLESRPMAIISKLGEGAFADVFKVRFEGDTAEYACKRLKDHVSTYEEVRQLPEIQVLEALQGHPNIVRLFGIHFDSHNGTVFLILELLQQSLFELLGENAQPLSEEVATAYIYHMLKGLAHCHKIGIFHRDIKPENCMVNPHTLQLKLVDFGSTSFVNRQQPFTEYIATRWYRAPECILTAGSYGPGMDLWAAGCILCEMLLGRPVFPGQDEFDQIDIINRIIGTPPSDLVSRFLSNPNEQVDYDFEPCEGQTLRSIMPNVSDGLIELIESLLIYDPEKRITADRAIQLPIFERFRVVKSIRSSLDFPVLANGLDQNEQDRIVLATPVNSIKLQIPPVARRRTQVLNRLFNTRMQAAMRIKLYKIGRPKPKVYFSTRDRRLLPMIEAKRHVYA